MKPSISIITPSYNQGKFIERTILSVLSQNVKGIEYMIIDGGSVDETISILEKYSDKLSWVSEKDNGHSDAINKGILRSSGDIIGWLNSDDIYYPNALNEVLYFFETHPELEVVYGDSNHIDPYDQFIDKYPTEEWNWERLLETCFIPQPATFLRRIVFEKYGLMDIRIRYSMDYEYWIRLGKQGVKFAYLPKLLAATRFHQAAATIAQREKIHREINDFMVSYFGKVPDQWIFNYAHAFVRSYCFQDSQRWRFSITVSLVTLYSALHWNHGITSNIWKTVFRWSGGNTKRILILWERFLIRKITNENRL